jgi:hypothetical protein
LHDWLLALACIGVLRRASPAYADDERSLAGQAAAAAQGQITADPNSFGGDSRLTTWAGKFGMYAVTAAAGRRCWHAGRCPMSTRTRTNC